jgi:hypothetical protein
MAPLTADVVRADGAAQRFDPSTWPEDPPHDPSTRAAADCRALRARGLGPAGAVTRSPP